MSGYQGAKVSATAALAKFAPVDKRPVCAYCGRRLKPKVVSADVPADALPKIGDKVQASLGEQVCRGVIRVRTPILGELRMQGKVEIYFWNGKYDGWGRDKNNDGLFCTYNCGVKFGAAAFRGGYRMPKVDRD